MTLTYFLGNFLHLLSPLVHCRFCWCWWPQFTARDGKEMTNSLWLKLSHALCLRSLFALFSKQQEKLCSLNNKKEITKQDKQCFSHLYLRQVINKTNQKPRITWLTYLRNRKNLKSSHLVVSLYMSQQRQHKNKKSKCSHNPYSPYLQDFFTVISLT